MRISFPHGPDHGVIAAEGDFDLPVASILGHRFHLVDGTVVDRYGNVSDGEVKEIDARAAEARRAADLETARAARIQAVKREAGERIAALDWKVTRARERDLLNGSSTVDAVYGEREIIRQASNQAEAVVAGLNTLEEIRGFSW
nr:conserved uncharacterized protein [uncultured bacterium]